ncbi:hypothetical protein niasHT_037996 [Heterodera trifolii]|uniref:Transcription factor AP-2 C-terminal domain-containing protein n=1 Tax=Heterodera trifolii TaxID=157864 RepID=A0ABD2HSZ3_9BILA
MARPRGSAGAPHSRRSPPPLSPGPSIADLFVRLAVAAPAGAEPRGEESARSDEAAEQGEALTDCLKDFAGISAFCAFCFFFCAFPLAELQKMTAETSSKSSFCCVAATTAAAEDTNLIKQSEKKTEEEEEEEEEAEEGVGDASPPHPFCSSPPSSSFCALPKESELSERKRPAAIQELLEKKRARLAHNESGSKSERRSMTPTTDGAETKLAREGGDERREMEEEERGENGRTMPMPSKGENDGTGGNGSSSYWPTEREDSETVSSCGSSSAFGAYNGGIFCNSSSKSPFASSAIGELNLGQLLKRAFGESSRILADPQMFAAIQETMLQKYAVNGTTAALAAALLSNKMPTDEATSTRKATMKATGTPSPVKRGGERDGAATSNGTTAAGDGVVALNIVPNDKVFSQVPGRLSLLSNVVKYKVTVGEIKRRLIGPESFNFSLLGAMLRRAKMPEKSAMLMGELNQVGLSIPRGRRRLSQVTLLSALTETESTQFARDFKKLAESDFPSEQLASELVRQRTKRRTPAVEGAQETPKERVAKLRASLKLAEEFLTLLEQDRSPIMDTVPEPILRPEMHEALSNFSMLTHGFGNPAVQVGVACFVSCLRHQIHLLEEQRPNGTATRTK